MFKVTYFHIRYMLVYLLLHKGRRIEQLSVKRGLTKNQYITRINSKNNLRFMNNKCTTLSLQIVRA